MGSKAPAVLEVDAIDDLRLAVSTQHARHCVEVNPLTRTITYIQDVLWGRHRARRRKRRREAVRGQGGLRGYKILPRQGLQLQEPLCGREVQGASRLVREAIPVHDNTRANSVPGRQDPQLAQPGKPAHKVLPRERTPHEARRGRGERPTLPEAYPVSPGEAASLHNNPYFVNAAPPPLGLGGLRALPLEDTVLSTVLAQVSRRILEKLEKGRSSPRRTYYYYTWT